MKFMLEMEETMGKLTKEGAREAAFKIAPMFERLSSDELRSLVTSFMSLSDSAQELVPAALIVLSQRPVGKSATPKGEDLTKLVAQMFSSMGYPKLDDKEELK